MSPRTGDNLPENDTADNVAQDHSHHEGAAHRGCCAAYPLKIELDKYAGVKSTIIFTGTESPRELVQKISDLQRQHDNRLSALEKMNSDLEQRVSELED